MINKILFGLLIISSVSIFGQELREVVSASPETAALAKFINTPVNYHNGLPSIEVPLYTIRTRSGLSIPIKLSYHASGIKVNEHATQVGLGWKLSTGGMISAQTYGETDGIGARKYPNHSADLSNSLSRFSLIDELGNAYCASPDDMTVSYQYALEASGIGFSTGTPKLWDAQPDIFYYEMPTGSGKFVYDSDFKAHTIPYSPISITNAIGNPQEFITIKDGTGNVYEYNNPSWYSTIPQMSVLSNISVEQHKLSRITTSLKEVIDYTYSNEVYNYKNPASVIDYTRLSASTGGCGNLTHSEPQIETRFANQRLDKIDFDGGRVEFYYSDTAAYAIQNSTTRKDLPGATALRRVVVYNTYNTVIKDFELHYSYFVATSGPTTDPDKYRLKLDSITEKGQNPYNFIYYGNGTIPHRLSSRQDYWGYYGGTGGLLPAVKAVGIELPGSDRSVNEALIKTGTLQKITYPTKGSINFYFNEVDYMGLQEEISYVKRSTPVFNTTGTHAFTLPADADNQRKVFFQNGCGNSGSEIQENYCYFKVLNQNNQVLAQGSNPGTYTINTTTADGVSFKFILEGNPFQTCTCSIYMEGEEETTTMVTKKTQLPGLRLDRMVSNPLTGPAITTTYDYKRPGSNEISKTSSIPKFHYIKKSMSDSGGVLKDCRYLVRSGSPVITYQSGYEHVMEKTTGNGYRTYTFNPSSSGSKNTPLLNISFDAINGGKLIAKETYSQTNKVLSKEEYSFTEDYSVNQKSSDYIAGAPQALTLGMSFNSFGSWVEDCNLPGVGPKVRYLLDYNIYSINSGWLQNKQTKSTIYYYNENDVLSGSALTTTDYFYGDAKHAQVVRTEQITNTGEVIETKTYYPDDVDVLTGLTVNEKNTIKRLQKNDLHQFAIPIQSETWKKEGSTSKRLNTQRTLFLNTTTNMVLPNIVQAAKDQITTANPLTARIGYHTYDDYGNPLEVSKADGPHIIYIWGYSDQYPIAKISNATYSGMPAAVTTLINQIKTTSNTENSITAENAMRAKFKTLREHVYFEDAQITCYTYDPLIGVTSVTDPKGYTMTYHYDSFNRLEKVKDQEGNILSENEYHYKNN